MKNVFITSLVVFWFTLLAMGQCEFSNVMPSHGVCNTNPYVLVFGDDFEGSELDLTKWIPAVGVVRDEVQDIGQQWYDPNNIVINNGKLEIITKRIPIEYRCFDIWKTGQGMVNYCKYFQYTSGEIDSKYKFGYGKYEIRCKIAKGKGMGSAFWTYGEIPHDDWNEIDVFEFANQKKYGKFNLEKSVRIDAMNMHGDFNNKYQNNPDTSNSSCSTSFKGPDFSSSYHTFTVVYTPYKLEWYVDGVLKRRDYRYYDLVTGQAVGCNSVKNYRIYSNNIAFPIAPMSIIFDCMVQSDSDAPNPNDPFQDKYVYIDYIKYYKQIACQGNIFISNNSQLNEYLNNNEYSVIVGQTITIGSNVTIPNNQQLSIIASDKIVFETGATNNSSDFTATIDPNVCGTSGMMEPDRNTNEILETLNDVEENYIREENIDSSDNNKIKVYPNPTNKTLFLEFNSEKEANNFYFYLTDEVGKDLFERDELKGKKISIDMSGFKNGVYILNLINKETNTKYNYRIIKTQ